MFGNLYEGKKVLITGHSGFKGSWLTLWLEQLGAEVYGYSLYIPPSEPDHFSLLETKCTTVHGDIRNLSHIQKIIGDIEPEIVFHLAAQSLVRKSYASPVETFETNCMGSVNILEAIRTTASVRAVVVVTSDKCYENQENGIPFIESDPMGGHDPYSASKGAVELIVTSYRSAYFHPKLFGKTHNTLIASVRAGNVIGGGDWGGDRLVPDIMRAAAENKTVEIRSPDAIRPWQHVLDPLGGYLLLGQKLLEGDRSAASSWNFGPAMDDHLTVQNVCLQIQQTWPAARFFYTTTSAKYHEAQTLFLDCSKARQTLQWRPLWNCRESINKATEWYKAYYRNKTILSEQHLSEYLLCAKMQDVSWIN